MQFKDVVVEFISLSLGNDLLLPVAVDLADLASSNSSSPIICLYAGEETQITDLLTPLAKTNGIQLLQLSMMCEPMEGIRKTLTSVSRMKCWTVLKHIEYCPGVNDHLQQIVEVSV